MAYSKDMHTHSIEQLDAVEAQIIQKKEVVEKQYAELEEKRKKVPNKNYSEEFLSLYQESEKIQVLQLQYKTMIMTNQFLLIIRFAEAP